MDQIRTILEMYLATGSVKGAARRLNVSKNTVRNYVRQAEAHTADLRGLLVLPDEDLSKLFYGPKTAPKSDMTPNREQVFEGQATQWLKELRRVGVTRHLLWEEYLIKHPDGYGYSQFCERLRREIGRKDLTISLNHTPGEVMQVDFTGKKMEWVDESTGEVHSCEVLVAVFPHSQYTFVIALPSQKVRDFVYGLNQALLFFGKLPNAILSDNLKSYVTKADRYDPKFNELCEQLAAYYQLELRATRVAKPKDKASVENMVSTVYRRIYAPLRNSIFFSMADLNAAIREQLVLHNNKAYQKKEGCRTGIYNKFELPNMRRLPNELFEVKSIAKAKVQRNYHVFLGQDKHYYSVPFRFARKDALVIYNSKTVEIYVDSQRVAVHSRLSVYSRNKYQTILGHMPENHREWREAKGYDVAYFIREAGKIGTATRWLIEEMLLNSIHQAQAFKSCKGILHMKNEYSPQRLEQAAERCKAVNKASYGMIKRILRLNLDEEGEKAPSLFNVPPHDNIRGPQAYQ